jgi:hypothetical protein
MSEYDLKDAIDKHMPFIDELLQESKIPIFHRFMRAASIFVDVATTDPSYGSKEELLKSEAFFEGIIPLINDWYWEKYGELAKYPNDKVFSGIISPYGQPVLIKIPSTTSRVEVPNETAWLTFPDCLQESESLTDMAQTPLVLDKLPLNEKEMLFLEFNNVVSMTRSINLNIMSASELDAETANMAKGVWSHFEKAIVDILSFQSQQASIGCWELHLAIEKTLKVYLKQADGKRHYGHNLNALGVKAAVYSPDIDLSIIKSLPSDKDAIQLRYSELVKSVDDTLDYYKKALALVAFLSRKLSRKYKFNNASFLIKMVPWAK